ncbi:hypothetical protein GGH93_006252, partial [Coemansia aciculifera]
MPHINSLPKNILVQILYYVAASSITIIYEWKYKLPLLAVCRAWTKLAIDIVFNQVYIELAISPGSLLNARPFWTSNAELLISRGYVLAARRLTIEFADKITPKCLQRIALEILKLDCVDWQRINSLTITGPATAFKYYIGAVAVDDLTSADIMRTMQYFGRNLRNVVELNLAYSNIASMGEYICFCFATVYGGQLQIHRASMSIPCSLVNFSRNIKVLELTLDSSAARVLPSICGETLKVLKLKRVPLNFAWHHFRYDLFSRPIVFRQLTILHLSFEGKEIAYTEVEIQDKIASDLRVEIHSSEPGETAEIYKVTNHLFADICIGRTASLLYNIEPFPLDPELIRWANLTKLEVITVDYTTLCKLIAQLPSLTELSVHLLEFGDMVMSSSAEDLSLFISADPMLAWGERLVTLMIIEFDDECPLAVRFDGVQALLMHASALSWLFVPESMESHLTEFIDAYKNRYAIPAVLSTTDTGSSGDQAEYPMVGLEGASSSNVASMTPAPVCIWDGIQVNDPEPISPIPAYAFEAMPQHSVGPGSIDSDVMHMVRRLSLKEKVGQMTQIEVGQLID